MTLFVPITLTSNGTNKGRLYDLTGNSMVYLATWLNGAKIVAEDRFEDLLAAQNFVLDNMVDYRISFGADGVKIWNGHTIYFEWAPVPSA